MALFSSIAALSSIAAPAIEEAAPQLKRFCTVPTESKERKYQKKERKDKRTKEWKTGRKKIGIDFFKTKKEEVDIKINCCM